MKETKQRKKYSAFPIFNKQKGERVLFLDGGGVRGLIQTEVLSHITEMTGRTIPELFDWIVGTSTGGIVALALVYAPMIKGIIATATTTIIIIITIVIIIIISNNNNNNGNNNNNNDNNSNNNNNNNDNNNNSNNNNNNDNNNNNNDDDKLIMY